MTDDEERFANRTSGLDEAPVDDPTVAELRGLVRRRDGLIGRLEQIDTSRQFLSSQPEDALTDAARVHFAELTDEHKSLLSILRSVEAQLGNVDPWLIRRITADKDSGLLAGSSPTRLLAMEYSIDALNRQVGATARGRSSAGRRERFGRPGLGGRVRGASQTPAPS